MVNREGFSNNYLDIFLIDKVTLAEHWPNTAENVELFLIKWR